MRLLSVDPSLKSCGWALWNDETLTRVGIISGGKGEWWERAQHVATELRKLVLTWDNNKADVVAEFTEFHGAANKMMGWKTGDLQKLTFLSGCIAGRMYPRKFTPVTTSGWKGQLPKDVAARRVEKILGKKAVVAVGLPPITRKQGMDAWDAVGIGLWYQGRF
jgi:hypothetical protein